MGAARSSYTSYGGGWGQVTVMRHHEEEKVSGVATMVFYTSIQATESGSSLGSSDDGAFGQA